MIILEHQLEDLFQDPPAAPFLKASMDTTTGAEPVGLERLPLAACAQDMQNAIHPLAVGKRRSSDGAGRLVGRQNLLDSDPEFVGNGPQWVITDGSTPCSLVGWETAILQESALLVNSGSIHG